MKDRIFDIDRFGKLGFTALEDTTKEAPGALRIMRNAQVTRRGNLAPRPGTLLIGTKNANTEAVRGLYNFKKSFGTAELFIKAYDTKLEYISSAYSADDWTTLDTGYTSGAEFGFATSLVNTANDDYVVGGNRYEPFFRWSGGVAQITSALVGGETSIPVDSTILSDVYDAKTASASSATTLDVAGTPWAADQWIGFAVLIKTGALAGKVRLITDNDNNTLTFSTLGSDPASPQFEIRRLKFPASGNLIYNGTQIAYTAIDTETSFTVASAHAAPDNSLITSAVEDYVENPRGDRFCNYLGRIVVGNVRSALARGSGGVLEGYASSGSVFISKLLNPFDFTYSGTRVAGEGDLISMPYGGGNITDVSYHEDTFYAFKADYIESVKYSQDANDLAVRDPLKEGIGSVGKVIKGADDIYFITNAKQFTSIGRVKTKDIRPQTMDLGDNITRFLDNCGFDDLGRGKEIGEKIYIPMKSSETINFNDIILVYNRNSKIFEGIWDIPANVIEEWNDFYHYGSSTSPDVYQLFRGFSDVEGTERFGIDFEVRSHWMNLTPSKAYLQSMYGIVVEGYVAGGATFSTKVWGDFANDPFLEFNFSFDESAYLDGSESFAFLGGSPLGFDHSILNYSDPDDDGMRHFMFRVMFPFQYHNYYSFGFSSSEPDTQYEISRTGLIIKEDVSINQNRVKLI